MPAQSAPRASPLHLRAVAVSRGERWDRRASQRREYSILVPQAPNQNQAERSQKQATTSMTLTSGERFGVVDKQPRIIGVGHWPGMPVERMVTPDAAQKEHKRLHEVWCNSANSLSGHLCTLDCLLQPPLTCLNRQVRDEALPVFYAINKFHFEMENFVVATCYGWWRKNVRSPVDWWRVIGSTNMRSIRHLNVVGQYDYLSERTDTRARRTEKSVMLEYRRSPRSAQITQSIARDHTCTAGPMRIRALLSKSTRAFGLEASYLTKQQRKEGDLEKVLQPHLDGLRQDGLEVRALESIVAALEPIQRHYMRDEYALQGLKRMGAVTEQQSEGMAG